MQKLEVQLDLFGRKLKGSRDVLSGYRVFEIEIREEGFLSGGESSIQLIARPTGNGEDRIEGMVFEMTTEEIKRADGYEPEEYKRVQVRLQSGRNAWIYAAMAG